MYLRYLGRWLLLLLPVFGLMAAPVLILDLERATDLMMLMNAGLWVFYGLVIGTPPQKKLSRWLGVPARLGHHDAAFLERCTRAAKPFIRVGFTLIGLGFAVSTLSHGDLPDPTILRIFLVSMVLISLGALFGIRGMIAYYAVQKTESKKLL